MKLRALLFSTLLFAGCFGDGSPERAVSGKIGQKAEQVQVEVLDRAAGTNAAIEHTTQKLPESREKQVILMFTGDLTRLVGKPKIETETQFLKAAEDLLSADATTRALGETQRLKLSTQNQELKTQLAELKKAHTEALAKEDADHKANLAKLRQESEDKQKRMISWIFFGGGGVLVAGGVAMLVFAAKIPMFGPKAAFGTMLAGGVSILTGVLILQLMKQLDDHPWILWASGGVIALIMTVVGSLLYANQKHATS